MTNKIEKINALLIGRKHLKSEYLLNETFREENGIIPAGRCWIELVIKQDVGVSTSHFRGEVWAHYKPNEVVEGVYYELKDYYSSVYFTFSRFS